MRITLLIVYLFISITTYSQTKPNIERIDDSVVLIKIYDYKNQELGHGSGIIIHENGQILTNYHVIEDAFKLEIITEINGVQSVYIVDEILKGDKDIDLAIVKLKNQYNKKFTPLKISNSPPVKGDECWAIGTPVNPIFMNTVSDGLVSNLIINEGVKIIQTNAEIGPGSSGGALINNKGELIGVTSSGYNTKGGARASINFAVDIREVNNLKQINKPKIVDPNLIPCEISFYTNSSLGGSAHLYVNQNYIGTFSKYFPSREPNCGDAGTITRTLTSGRHYYYVYYSKTNEYSPLYYVDLKPGDCHKVNVLVNSNKKSFYNSSPAKRPSESLKSAVYTFMANSTPYTANAFDGRVFSLGFEQSINDQILLRLKIQSPREYISLVEYQNGASLSWDERYSCSYDYKALFFDVKVFDNIFDEYFSKETLEKKGGPWWGMSLSFLRLKKERISGVDSPIIYPNQHSLGIGAIMGYDWHFGKAFMFTSEILWMKYFNKEILDEGRYNGTVISPQSSSFCISISLAYRFNKEFLNINKKSSSKG